MRIESDLNERDLKAPPPKRASAQELKKWKYQRYIKDYLRCIAGPSTRTSVVSSTIWIKKA